eukprot:scaffold11571_cov119-Isochrysis_galbana.AAC.6
MWLSALYPDSGACNQLRAKLDVQRCDAGHALRRPLPHNFGYASKSYGSKPRSANFRKHPMVPWLRTAGSAA